MAEEYDIQAIMAGLKNREEMDPDSHDGCYELMRETIGAYGKLDDLSDIDYKDLNLVYLTTVGTWKQGVDGKKKVVEDSHLLPDDKEYLTILWDEVWKKACNKEYTNNELDASGESSIGLFGTGFFSFQRTTTAEHSREFIQMCCDILPMTEDEQMFLRAEQVLTESFKGMRAASASMVLHCLKPYSFPVLNSNMGRQNVFEVLGVHLVKRGNIETYIDNCRKIKAFRDSNFLYKNYRIFDIAAWRIVEYAKKHAYGKFGSWEIISETIARLDLVAGIMSRLKELRAVVDAELNRMENTDKRTGAINHLYGVSLAATMIAKKRGLDPELAAMAAMLHDLHAYKTGSYDDHAHKGADLAREILGQLGVTNEAETETICSAIYHHDDKLVVDGPMDEVLKDTDVIHHCMNDLSKAVKDKEKARFETLCREFGME